jgi:hypothetical protein
VAAAATFQSKMATLEAGLAATPPTHKVTYKPMTRLAQKGNSLLTYEAGGEVSTPRGTNRLADFDHVVHSHPEAKDKKFGETSKYHLKPSRKADDRVYQSDLKKLPLLQAHAKAVHEAAKKHNAK